MRTLWLSIDSEEKFLYNISMWSSASLYFTLSIFSWSSSSHGEQSILSQQGKVVGTNVPITLLIHPTMIPFFSYSSRARHLQNYIIMNIQNNEGHQFSHALIELLKNKFLKWGPVEHNTTVVGSPSRGTRPFNYEAITESSY